MDNTVAGACYPKVRVTWDGLSLLSTPMKPGKCEKLLIVVQNQTEEEQHIDINRKIAIVMLHKLNSNTKKPDKNDTNRNWEKRENMTSKFEEKKGNTEWIFRYEYLDDNNEKKLALIDTSSVKREMRKTEAYKDIKKRLLRPFRIIGIVLAVALVVALIVVLVCNRNRLTLAELLALITILMTLVSP